MHEFPITTKPEDIINEIVKYNKKINFNILIEDNLFIKKILKNYEKNYWQTT